MESVSPPRSGHPRALWTLAFVELCRRGSESVFGAVVVGTLGGQLGGGSSGLAAYTAYIWLKIVAIVPGGWFGDRFLGAKGAAALGAITTVAGLFIAAIGSVAGVIGPAVGPLTTTYLGMGALIVGSGLLRGNLVALLGRAYDAREPRRTSGFIWFDGVANVGQFLGIMVGRQFEFATGPAWLAVAGLITTIAFLRLIRGGDVVPPTDSSAGEYRRPPDQPAINWRHCLLVATAAIALAAGLFALRESRLADRSVLAGIIFSAVVLVFLFWQRPSRTDSTPRVARQFKCFVVLVVGFALARALTAISFRSFALTEWSLSIQQGIGAAAISILCAPLVTAFWRRRTQTGEAPSMAFAFTAGFLCLVLTFIAIGISFAVSYSTLAVFLLTGLASVFVTTSGLNAATKVAPPHLTGTMVGVLAVAGSAGGYLSSEVGDALVTIRSAGLFGVMGAACSGLVGLLFLANRRSLEAAEAGEPAPSSPPRSRMLATATGVCGLVLTVTIGWLVMGRGVDGGAALAAASPRVTFRGADEASLPDKPLLGFAGEMAGAVEMGADVTIDPLAASDEVPLRDTFVGPFYIGMYEVTVAQYKQCVTEGACTPADPRAVAGPETEWPVRYVTWTEALDYCVWLESKLTRLNPALFKYGGHVTLPSEAEWEFAAGVVGRVYPWIGVLTPERANYVSSGRLAPVRVGEFAAGATDIGVHDLSGNVAEWTRSEYRPYPYDKADGREDTRTPGTTRVIRGGSFYDGATLLRVSARQAADPARGYEFVGFRVVIAQVPDRPVATK